MSKQFTAGDKVKCVNAGNGYGLVAGRVYTVTGKGTAAFETITVAGADNGLGFYPDRFELVQEQPQNEFRIRPIYKDGSAGVDVVVQGEEAVRDYLKLAGTEGVRYEYYETVPRGVFTVTETVTREVQAA